MEMEHFSHKHPLTLCEKKHDDFSSRVDCSDCEELCSGPTYGCNPCNFFIHKSCAELPEEIRNPFHQHPLTLLPYDDQRFMCDYCQLCGFALDIECALPKVLNHKHPLTLGEEKHDGFLHRVKCSACERLCSGQTYGCISCKIFIHKSCAELPEEIQNPFHRHPLTLLPHDHDDELFVCDACGEIRQISCGFTYCCELCGFILDVECAFPKLNVVSVGDGQIRHFSHKHPLALSEKEQEKDDELHCIACEKHCSDQLYGCRQCQFYIHKSCAELPLEIQHPSHPFHPLVLVVGASRHPERFWCHSCHKDCRGFTFRCYHCNFNLDVECAFLFHSKESESEGQGYGQIRHANHEHPLTLSEKNDDEGLNCTGCEKPCSGSTYGCTECDFFLHKSCAELPQEIQHHSDPFHSLTLFEAYKYGETYRCDACLKTCHGFIFRCYICNFNLDVECAFLMPTIKFKGHTHRLIFIENIYAKLQCNACNTACESSVFRCLECDFSLHLLCGPLPCTIKHKCHVDPLTLVDFLIEEDTEEFCCDACEKERNPWCCVYYCADCTYIAHVDCVISEVILSLKGERGNVALRTVGRQIEGKVISQGLQVKEMKHEEIEQDSETDSDTWEEEVETNPALTINSIFCSLSHDEQKEFMKILDPMQRGILQPGETLFETKHEDSDSIPIVSPYSDEAFTEFMERLDSGMSKLELLLRIEGEEVKFVEVGDYMAARILAPIHKDLFSKYGDISAESFLTPRVKTIFISILCGAVHSMCKTKVVDITENILLIWWSYLKAVQRAGFNIQFAIDNLKRVVRAHFGLQARKFAEDTLVKQDEDIAQLSEEIKELTVKLEVIKEEREQHITYAKFTNSSIMKECLSEAAALKWKTAGEAML